MKTRGPVAVPDERTIPIHMSSGAVVRLRPSELVGLFAGGLKPKRRNLIDLTNQIEAARSKSSGRHRAQ